jgi:transposase-like protein
MVKRKKEANKQQIVSEYLTGELSFKALGEKYGVKDRTIQTWVRSFRKHSAGTEPIDKKSNPLDIKQLQKQLKQAQLKNELLEEMLRLSEEQTGIDFRKKFGTKQS